MGNKPINDVSIANRLRELSIKAIETFGCKHQTQIAIEELAELIMTIQHVERGKKDLSDLASEIADVEIMLFQLKLMTLEHKKYLEVLNKKLDKLEGHLSND